MNLRALRFVVRGYPAVGKRVRLIYFDEAGVGNMVDEPLCVVACVMIEGDHQWQEIEADVEEILNTVVPETEREGFEFRAKALFSRDKSLTKGKWTRAARETALEKFLEIIPKHKIISVAAAVDRKGWNEHFPQLDQSHKGVMRAQDFAFMSCLNTLNLLFKVGMPDEVGICIADNTERWRWMKDLLRHYQKHTIGGEHEEELTLTRIIDSVYFGDSHESIGLQLADSCAFFLKRHLMGKTNSDNFYRIIEKQILIKDVQFAS